MGRADTTATSASPSAACDSHDYLSIGAQLRTIMHEACAEPPPGVDRAAVEQRIQILQDALSTVEERVRTRRLRAEALRAQGQHDHQLRRARLDAERDAAARSAEEQRVRALLQQQEEERRYYAQRSNAAAARIVSCRAHTDEVVASVERRAAVAARRRAEALRRMHEDREGKVSAACERDAAWRTVLRRHRQQLAADRAARLNAIQRLEERVAPHHRGPQRDQRSPQRDQRSPQRDQRSPQRDQRSPQRDQRSPQRDQRSPQRDQRSPQRSSQRAPQSAEAERGDVADELRRGMAEREEEHRQRYEATRAALQYERDVRAARHNERQQRQRQRYIQQLDERISRGDEILQGAREKEQRAERAIERRTAVADDVGQAIGRDIDAHRQRAEERERRRINGFLHGNYKRWNEHATRVMQQLRDAIKAEGAVTGQQPDGFLPPINAFRTERS